MLRRKAYDRLLEWKNEKNHNCLLVSGQRQIGKTFIISKFGEENYDNVIYADLSKDSGMRDAVKRESVDDIVNVMRMRRGGEGGLMSEGVGERVQAARSECQPRTKGVRAHERRTNGEGF